MNNFTNGRVVVVDDEESEALPLIKSLSAVGIPVRFFTGRASDLPDDDNNYKVRLLFLDFQLEGMNLSSMDGTDIARALKPVVEKIIGPENGPYILFGWTKHPEYMAALVNELDRKPVLQLIMPKNDCIVNGIFDINTVKAKLVEQLKELGHFLTIFKWEAMVNDSAADTVNTIFAGNDKDAVGKVLFCIAEAGLGQHIGSLRKEEKIKLGLQCFGSILSDSIDNKLSVFDFSNYDDLDTPANPLDNAIKSKINSKILLMQPLDDLPCPGNIYHEFDTARKASFKHFLERAIDWDKLKKKCASKVDKNGKDEKAVEIAINACFDELKKKILDENKIVIAEITAICDYAQNKQQYHKVLPCFLVDEETREHFHKNLSDGAYLSNFFLFIDNSYKKQFALFFDFRMFATIGLSELDGKKPIFRLNKHLLFDVQHRVASHFARPGLVSLPYQG